MLLSWLYTLHLCLIGSGIVLAQGTRYWVQPPSRGDELLYVNNPTYTVNSVLELNWSTDQDSYQIWLWQQNMYQRSAAQGSAIFTKQAGGSPRTTYNWTVTAQAFDLSQSGVFFLALGSTPNLDGNATTCHYFNMTQQSTSTSSASSVTSSSTSTTGNSLSTSPPQSSSSNQSNSQSTSGSGSKLELGLGLGLGIPLLIVLAAVAIFFFVKRPHKYDYSKYTGTQSPPIVEHQHARNNIFSQPQVYEIRGDSTFEQGKPWNNAPPQYHQTAPVEMSGGPRDTQ